MNIRRKRMSKGLTQEELAKELGIKRNTVSMWETGKSNPTTERLLDVAKALGCSVDELYDDTDQAKKLHYKGGAKCYI